MTKIGQKVKANPYDFGQLWALFNFSKMAKKQRETAFESFSTTPNVIFRLFKPF